MTHGTRDYQNKTGNARARHGQKGKQTDFWRRIHVNRLNTREVTQEQRNPESNRHLTKHKVRRGSMITEAQAGMASVITTWNGLWMSEIQVRTEPGRGTPYVHAHFQRNTLFLWSGAFIQQEEQFVNITKKKTTTNKNINTASVNYLTHNMTITNITDVKVCFCVTRTLACVLVLWHHLKWKHFRFIYIKPLCFIIYTNLKFAR